MDKEEESEGISRRSVRPTPAMISQLAAQTSSAVPRNEPDDRRLVHETLQGSQTAFQTLIERYQVRIFRLLHRFVREPHETEDLAQDVFLKVFKRLHTFQFESAFYTWLYRIAINTAMDHVQRKRRSPVQAVEDVTVFEKGSNESASPDQNMVRHEMGKAAREVLARMPEKYRVILELREYEEMSYDEIAKVMDCAMGTVESRLFRAREKFREILIELYPEYAAQDDVDGEGEA